MHLSIDDIHRWCTAMNGRCLERAISPRQRDERGRGGNLGGGADDDGVSTRVRRVKIEGGQEKQRKRDGEKKN